MRDLRAVVGTGDICYRAKSAARLDLMIAETLKAASGASAESHPDLFKGQHDCKFAPWMLVKVCMDMPLKKQAESRAETVGQMDSWITYGKCRVPMLLKPSLGWRLRKAFQIASISGEI